MKSKKFIQLIKPGIRAKLILFTLVLLVSFGSLSFMYLNWKENKWIQESFQKEIQAPLSYINSLSLDMENLTDTLILLEDAKIRILKKEKENKKNKKKILSKTKESLYFGLLEKEKYKISYKDTYYSEYLEKDEIDKLTDKIKGQFRDENGVVISDKKFAYFQSIAAKVANYRKEVESLEFKSDKTKRESNTLAVNQKYYSREMKKLRSLIQDFFRNKNKFDIEELGFDPRNIRIQSFDKGKNLFLDTGRLIDGSSFSSRRLFAKQEFKDDKDKLLEYTTEELFESSPEKKTIYNLGKNHFELVTRPFFKNPLLTERAKLILSDIETGESQWEEYIRRDIQISYEFAVLVEDLRKRREEILKKGIPPYKDKSYMSLYKDYKNLVAKRRSEYDAFHPYPDENKIRRESIQKSIKEEKEKKKDREDIIEKNKKRILQLTKNMDNPSESELTKEETESVYLEEIDRLEKEIDLLGSDIESINEEILQLEITLNSWSEYPKLKLGEAYKNIREAGLKSHILLPYKNDALAYEKFLRDNSIFFPEHRRWKHIRNWIMDGLSETSIPKLYIPNRGKVEIFEDGILFRSRTEAEDYMWFLDSTPIYSFPVTNSSLAHILLFKNLAGYNLVLLDKTDTIEESNKSLQKLTQVAISIGVIFLVIAVMASFFAVRKLRRITDATEEIANGNLDVEFPSKGWDEIGMLGRTMSHMVVGLKEREELRGELEAAEEIQKRLLPERLPQVEGVEFAGFYKAMNGVGGDYYDFIEKGNHTFLVIADVSNHGVGPALVMAILRSQLHSLIRKGMKDPKQILFELNRFLYAETPDTIFVTMFLGVFIKDTSSLVYASAGHNKPIIYRKEEDTCKYLKAGGLPLGMDENDFFETTIDLRKTTLSRGDFFFQYTDGVNEAMDTERNQYGMERMYKCILKEKSSTCDGILQAIVKDVEVFTEKKILQKGPSELNDDIAMIGMRIL